MKLINNIVFITLFILLTFIASSSFAAQNIIIKDTPQAIDLAGKQRMLTQRMLKNYVLLAMNKGVASEKQQLEQDILLFSNTLEALNNYTESINYNIPSDNVEMYWGMLQQLLSTQPSKIVVTELQRGLDTLLEETNRYTVALTKRSGQNSSIIINISGKQRMFSQRLASLYFINLLGIKDKDFQKKLDASIQSFEKTQTKLEQYSRNTASINKKLKQVSLSFKFFTDLASGKIKNPMPLMINLNSNAIMQNMDKITKEYAQSAVKPTWGQSPI